MCTNRFISVIFLSLFCLTPLDNQPPVITCPTDVVNGTDTGSPTKTVTWSDPVAEDNSQLHDPNAAPTVVKSPNNIASPYDFPIGTTRITYTATDRSNNSQSCVFAVTVAGKSGVGPTLISNIFNLKFASFFFLHVLEEKAKHKK